jgi:hypothetical protein
LFDQYHDSNKSLETPSQQLFNVHHWFPLSVKKIIEKLTNLNLKSLKNHGSNLKQYQRYIDFKTSEGLRIFNSTLHDFDSQLAEGAKINLISQDFQKLSDNLNCLRSQYGYNHVFKHAPTTQMIIPAIPPSAAVAAIVADSTTLPPVLAAPAVLAVPAVTEEFNFWGFQNIPKTYSADNLRLQLQMLQSPGAMIHSHCKSLK